MDETSSSKFSESTLNFGAIFWLEHTMDLLCDMSVGKCDVKYQDSPLNNCTWHLDKLCCRHGDVTNEVPPAEGTLAPSNLQVELTAGL